MMNYTSNCYSEVNSFLNILDKKYIDMIPKDVYLKIKERMNKNFNPKFSSYFPISEQGISKEAMTIIAYLHYNFWCINFEEKRNLTKIFYNNEIKKQNIKKNYNVVFDNKSKGNDNKSMIVVKNENIFHKIVSFLKNIFGKKF